jgi:hypothetical protein
MSNNSNQEVVSIVNTLTDYLFSDRFDQSLIESKEHHLRAHRVEMTMELMRAILDKTATPEQLDLMEQITLQSLNNVNNVHNSIVFHLDGFRYHVKQKYDQYTVYSKYKAPDFSALPDKFKEPIVHDVEVIHEKFIKLTSLYPAQDFMQFKNKDRYSSNEFSEYCIVRLSNAYPVAYISKDFIELCNHFPEAFTAEQLEFIERNKVESFQMVDGSQKDLETMFNGWKKLLKKKKATSVKQFAFNDMDNYAFLTETETHLLMSQRSQNTLYAYVFEKSTGRYKVWTAAHEVKASPDDFYYSEMIDSCVNYLEMVQYYIGRDYGPKSYPVMIEHYGYVKSSQYHLDNFNDDDGLVYDSLRGFNLHSDHSGNLRGDFSLLIDVLDHYR